MTGQIPPYGRRGFRRVRVGYEATRNPTLYVLKRDASWHIQSDSTSERWQVFFRGVAIFRERSTLTLAMDKVLEVTEGE